MADAYVKTYTIDETFVMEDTNNGPDIMAFQLNPDNQGDMHIWNGYFVPDEVNNTPGLYGWVAPMALDAEGDFIDNSYNTAGVLFAITNFSTYGDPTSVRLKGSVQVMYLPVAEPTP